MPTSDPEHLPSAHTPDMSLLDQFPASRPGHESTQRPKYNFEYKLKVMIPTNESAATFNAFMLKECPRSCDLCGESSEHPFGAACENQDHQQVHLSAVARLTSYILHIAPGILTPQLTGPSAVVAAGAPALLARRRKPAVRVPAWAATPSSLIIHHSWFIIRVPAWAVLDLGRAGVHGQPWLHARAVPQVVRHLPPDRESGPRHERRAVNACARLVACAKNGPNQALGWPFVVGGRCAPPSHPERS